MYWLTSLRNECLCQVRLDPRTQDQDLPGGSVVKNPPANRGDTGDAGSITGSRRSPRGGNGNPLQYSCLENPMGRGAWWATVRGVAEELDTTERLSSWRSTPRQSTCSLEFPCEGLTTWSACCQISSLGLTRKKRELISSTVQTNKRSAPWSQPELDHNISPSLNLSL